MQNIGFDASGNEFEVALENNFIMSEKTPRNATKFKTKWNHDFKAKTKVSQECRKSIADVNDAVKDGKFDTIEAAISNAEKSRSLDDLDESGLSNLHHAVRYNRVEAVASLLKHGAQVNILSREEGNTPLHITSR